VIALVALAALTTLAAGPTAVAAPERVQRFALVVGHNQPPHADLPRLRYGDDDAVRWTILLRTFGADVELLTELDDESRKLYGDRAPAMLAPTREELGAAMERIGTAIRAAHAAGARTVFYFVYAGHGDVENGEGYVALSGGRLYRRDLEDLVLAASGADTNHVVVDACRSYYFVYDRGPGGTRQPWNSPYFISGAAARFRNTGFLLASSSEAPTHEWEEFQAGIFSHEVRSGLLGSADLDGDGRISYEEIAAFVHVANRPIRNAKFRPGFVARPPAVGDSVLLDLADASAGAVLTGKRPSARYLLEDELGVRWADLHPSDGHPVTLRLPAAKWSPHQFFFRPAGGQEEFRIKPGETVSLEGRTPVPVATLSRGAAHEAFAQLFAEPFDEHALASASAAGAIELAGAPAVVATSAVVDAPEARPLRTAAFVSLAAGAVALGGFTALSISGMHEHERGEASETKGVERASINDRIQTIDRWRAVTGIASALLVLGGAALYATDRYGEHPHVTVLPVPGGALAGISSPLW
jgi:hypothetical protein